MTKNLKKNNSIVFNINNVNIYECNNSRSGLAN